METARAILQHAIATFPGKKSLYRALAHLERQHGTPEAVAEVLERGVKYCPQVRASLHGPCPHTSSMVCEHYHLSFYKFHRPSSLRHRDIRGGSTWVRQFPVVSAGVSRQLRVDACVARHYSAWTIQTDSQGFL